MLPSVSNRYNFVYGGEQRKSISALSNKHTETTASEKSTNYDTVEISKDGLKSAQNQEPQKIDTIQSAEIDVSQNDAEENSLLNQLISEDAEQEPMDSMEEDSEESTSVGGSIGINAGKLARKLAAAKTKEQLQAVIAEIQQDLKECEAGEAQGMIVDEASVQAAQNLLNKAQQRMSSVAGREATPEEEMAFALAGLM